MIQIYTDGSSRGNPGPGGYGIVLKFNQRRKEMAQGYRLTTNNRMELLAIIVALESLKRNDLEVHIYSDSKYVIDSIVNRWVWSWQQKGYKGKKNADLWERFLKIEKDFKIHYHWVKGHNGHEENERCDLLATVAADHGPFLVDEVYEKLEG